MEGARGIVVLTFRSMLCHNGIEVGSLGTYSLYGV